MHDDESDDLDRRLGKLSDQVAIPRKGEVTATGPLKVTVAGGAELPEVVHYLSSYAPTVGDKILFLSWQNNLIILGKIV